MMSSDNIESEVSNGSNNSAIVDDKVRRCEIYMEDLMKEHQLKITDRCMVCNVLVGFHQHRSNGNNNSDSKAGKKDGTKSILPKWNSNKSVKPFLDKMERILEADLVDQSHWPRLLMKATDGYDSKWVKHNIVDEQLNWSEARKAFINHFEKYEYQLHLMNDYEEIRQGKHESTQRYADRFEQLAEELHLDNNNELAIQHFIQGLNQRNNMELRKHLTTLELSTDISDIKGSLKSMMDLAIKLDAINASCSANSSSYITHHSSGNNNSNGGHSKDHNNKENSNAKRQKKYCKFHPHVSSHNTADCRYPPKPQSDKNSDSNRSINNVSNNNSSSSKSDANKQHDPNSTNAHARNTLKCYVCGGNHLTNDPSCPRRSDRQTRSQYVRTSSATSTSNNNSSSNGNRSINTGAASSTSGFSSTSSSSSSSSRAFASTVVVDSKDDDNNNDYDNAEEKYESDLDPAELKTIEAQTLDRTIPEPLVASDVLQVMLVIKGYVYNTLLDTGASISFVDETLVQNLKLPIGKSICGKITLANGESVPNVGSALIDATVIFPAIKKKAINIKHRFELLKINGSNHDYHFIMGRDLIPSLFPHSLPSAYIRNPMSFSAAKVRSVSISSINITASTEVGNEFPRMGVSTPDNIKSEYAINRQILLDRLKPLLEINSTLSGFCNVPEAMVKLEVDPTKEHKLYRRQYPLPHSIIAATTEVIDRWHADRSICLAPPACRFNNPITPVPKKDDEGKLTSVRPCLDVRALNKALIINDRFPIPRIDDALESLGGNAIFSELDLKEAYLQFPLHPDSRPYTAFTWNGQQYMFVGCPFGLTLLTSYFQRVMSYIFRDLPFCFPYIDNIIFGSKDWESHYQHAALIIHRLNQVNLKLKPKFDNVGHSQLRCLGHIISKNGISVDPEKLKAVSDWPLPSTGAELQSFLGFCGFLRGHIRHYAELSGPLEAIKNNKILVHNDNTHASFDMLKRALLSSPILSFPDFDRPFHIACDASQTGIGGVLFQPSSADEFITPDNIISICSKKLQPSQQRWAAYKKELYAVVYCLRKFHQYIWGRLDLVVHTDHKPLIHMFTSHQLSPALQQWLDVLLDYHFDIKHRDGILNVMPDQLSRMFGSAYAQAPVWGVAESSDVFATNNKDSNSNIIAARAASVSSSNAIDNQNNHKDTDDNKASNSSHINKVDLLIELEKRGKACPSDPIERERLIAEAHSFGHFGREAIFKRLWTDGYWWPDMRADIIDHINNCDPCTRFVVVKSGFHPAKSITAAGPGDHFQIDTSIHLPPSPDGHVALLVLIDVFTGFVVLRPLKDTTAETVARKLWKIFALIGYPKILQSDNGSEFVNDVVRTLVRITGIEQRFITPYNPRSDGKVERSIRTVMSVIKKLLHGTSNHWPLFVSFAQLAFNNKISSLTNSTPFSLMFGRTINDMKDYSKTPPTLISLDDWKEHQQKILSLIYPAINDRIISGKNKLMASLNKQRRLLLPTSFPAGSTVMIIDPHRENKFEPKYIGPYTIVRRSHGGAYVLRDMSGDILDRKVPPDQIKMVSKKKRRIDVNSPIHTVDKIISHRGNPGDYEYLVHWKDYSDEDRTWEPASHFLDDSVIREYWKSITSPTRSHSAKY
jgi:RNase H-like domain found in reverse transcriptase/Integrase core domain/Reverse transcriptase (RNA-dependent DNA polymerase)/Integrase zinc binding domain/Chromo (CHRromatin Organisation MOdifier) domain/Retrotransposon gag protein/Aspartyl protease